MIFRSINRAEPKDAVELASRTAERLIASQDKLISVQEELMHERELRKAVSEGFLHANRGLVKGCERAIAAIRQSQAQAIPAEELRTIVLDALTEILEAAKEGQEIAGL
jgi:hypothetical protein